MAADWVGVNNGATGMASLDSAPSHRSLDDILVAGRWRVEAGRLVDDYAVVSVWVRELEMSGSYSNTAGLGGRGSYNVCRLLVPKTGTTFRRGAELAYNNTQQATTSGGTIVTNTNRAVVNTGLTVTLSANRVDGQAFHVTGNVEVASASSTAERALLSLPLDVTLYGGSPVQIAQIAGSSVEAQATIKQLTGGASMSIAEILIALE